MSDTNKIIIVVLVAVVVLFVLGIVVGAGDGIPSISVNGIKNSLIGLFPSPPLPINELSVSSDSPSGCGLVLEEGVGEEDDKWLITVPNGADCEFVIAPSEATIRSLKLQIGAGMSVNISTVMKPVEDKSMDVDTNLPSSSSNQITLSFFKSKLTDPPQIVTISQCLNAGGCVLTILD